MIANIFTKNASEGIPHEPLYNIAPICYPQIFIEIFKEPGNLELLNV